MAAYMLIGVFRAGVEYGVVTAYGASPRQSFWFSSTDTVVQGLLGYSIFPHLPTSREVALVDMAIKVISGFAGVFMTIFQGNRMKIFL